jgi:phenylacetate-CoA ligase
MIENLISITKKPLFNLFNNTINLEKSQWWTLGELEEFQDQRLREITKYAYDHIPGYRKKLESVNVKPREIQSKDDLWKLPTTTREELQNNSSFVNKNMIYGTLFTGGSTGNSLKYYESPKSGKIRWNAHLRGWSWNGYTPGKRLAAISSAQGII